MDVENLRDNREINYWCGDLFVTSLSHASNELLPSHFLLIKAIFALVHLNGEKKLDIDFLN